MNLKAVITDIQRCSIHDGAGIRTTVFFKGCPLRCKWCHNPECIDFEPQNMYYPEKCIECGKCDKGCFTGARVMCGQKMTVDEVFSQILLDYPYYGSDGGVTFSGGEPLCYAEFIMTVIEKCKAMKIHTAMETSLYIYNEEVLKCLDFVMADFKIWDVQLHERYTGVSNERIMKNFQKLDKLNVPFLVRTPVIKYINNNTNEIKNIVKFLSNLKNITRYELLPYHPLGVSKMEALGCERMQFEAPNEYEMEELRKYADIQRPITKTEKNQN